MTPRKAGQIYYDMAIEICYNTEFSPIIIQEVHELHTALSLISAGMGIALVPCSIQNFRINSISMSSIKKLNINLKNSFSFAKR